MNLDAIKITADDYGYCQERNLGIIKAVEAGTVNSVSVLVNGSCIEKITSHSNKTIKIGLHLNLTEGKPITISSEIPSLLNGDGYFFPKCDFQEQHKLFCIHEIEKEICNQILRFQSIFDSPPDYIDGHQHCHIFPNIIHTFIKCLKIHKITETRLPFELGVESAEWIKHPQMKFFQTIQKNSKTCRQLFMQNEIRFPRYFIGLSVMSKHLTIEKVNQALDLVKDDHENRKDFLGKDDLILEIMTHPGYASANHDAGCGIGPDDFAKSNDRLHEMTVLCSDGFKKYVSRVKDYFESLER